MADLVVWDERGLFRLRHLLLRLPRRGELDGSREALAAFVQTSHADDDFFLIGFNQRPNLLAEFADGDSLLSKLSLITAQGTTALYDAVYLGLEKVKQGRHSKRALLVISDGLENSSRYTRKQLRQLLKETDVQIYCIKVVRSEEGDDAADLLGRWNLEEISASTDGKAYFARSEAELADVTVRIALELRRQYSLGYVPTNAQRAGEWRKVSVRVNPPRGMSRLQVRAKGGYYAVPQALRSQ